eukprot:9258576-Pyramimonas_sp.AAC.1
MTPASREYGLLVADHLVDILVGRRAAPQPQHEGSAAEAGRRLAARQALTPDHDVGAVQHRLTAQDVRRLLRQQMRAAVRLSSDGNIFLDLFSGPFPVLRALRQQGESGISFDSMQGPEFDLTDRGVLCPF